MGCCMGKGGFLMRRRGSSSTRSPTSSFYERLIADQLINAEDDYDVPPPSSSRGSASGLFGGDRGQVGDVDGDEGSTEVLDNLEAKHQRIYGYYNSERASTSSIGMGGTAAGEGNRGSVLKVGGEDGDDGDSHYWPPRTGASQTTNTERASATPNSAIGTGQRDDISNGSAGMPQVTFDTLPSTSTLNGEEGTTELFSNNERLQKLLEREQRKAALPRLSEYSRTHPLPLPAELQAKNDQ